MLIFLMHEEKRAYFFRLFYWISACFFFHASFLHQHYIFNALLNERQKAFGSYLDFADDSSFILAGFVVIAGALHTKRF